MRDTSAAKETASAMLNERFIRRGQIVVALLGLAAGFVAALSGHGEFGKRLWAVGTAPVAVGLAVSIVRDLRGGRLGVDAIALLSMSGALALGQALAGAIIAVMYAGGNVLEDFAVGRAERDLDLLVSRSPRIAHRKCESAIEDVAVDLVDIGDVLLVRAGEVVPVDGQILSVTASLDESAVTGEPIPANRKMGEMALSGTVNAGEAFEMQASAIAGQSTYAGIVSMVTAAQTAKAPFIRMADRFAVRRGKLLRSYAYRFIEILAPHLSQRQIENALYRDIPCVPTAIPAWPIWPEAGAGTQSGVEAMSYPALEAARSP